MKKLIALLLALTLTGCVNSSGDDDSEKVEPVNIASDGGVITVTASPANVNIGGSGNSVDIGLNVDVLTLTIDGSNNLVTFGAGSSIQEIVITGNDNTVELFVGQSPSITNTGLGNTIN